MPMEVNLCPANNSIFFSYHTIYIHYLTKNTLKSRISTQKPEKNQTPQIDNLNENMVWKKICRDIVTCNIYKTSS